MFLPLVAVLSLSLPAADPGPPIDPATTRAALLSRVEPAFSEYVFHGEGYPESHLRYADELADRFKVSTRKLTFHRPDAGGPRKTRPGPFAAVVTINPRDLPSMRRFVTLFCIPKAVPADRTYDIGKPGDFARDMGVSEDAVKRNAALVEARFKGKSFEQFARDPMSARLLAGLFLSKPGKGPVHRYDDAYAIERQWWVDLKRNTLYAGDKVDSRPFHGPLPRKGDPASVVREGTEEEAGVKKGTAEKIDAVLQAFAKDTDHAFAVCIARKGVVVLHKAYGTRDGMPMTVDTTSWMASVTKTMSATLMLMLIDQGRVGLDDPVDRYLPPLRGLKVKKPLTIHHLYTHTNGLTLDKLPGWSDDQHDVPERIAAYYDRLRVGQEWSYTGTGNILGSKIVELVTGKAIPQAYREYLLGPLGCNATDVTDSHAGAFSVPLDMAKFAQMLLNKGAYGKHQFFREETFTGTMLPGKLDKLLGPGAKRQFGFGLDGNPKRFGHGTASGAVFSIDADRELVVVMTRNRYGKNQDKYSGLMWKAIDEGIAKGGK